MSNENLKLWNEVEKTNPAHTKKVTFGRAITAIDPYHQLKNATEQFGPAGDGWGWSVSQTMLLPTNELGILVRVWHNNPEKWIEQWGQASFYTDNAEKKKDKDCFKKATTDGITKCLSMLGFNADIFLGKFEDNKYVQDVTSEFKAKESPQVGIILKMVSDNDIAKVKTEWSGMISDNWHLLTQETTSQLNIMINQEVSK